LSDIERKNSHVTPIEGGRGSFLEKPLIIDGFIEKNAKRSMSEDKNSIFSLGICGRVVYIPRFNGNKHSKGR